MRGMGGNERKGGRGERMRLGNGRESIELIMRYLLKNVDD